jgi:hypothetical protein
MEQAPKVEGTSSGTSEFSDGLVVWLPIATAPKDRTPIDIFRPGCGGERCVNMMRTDLGKGNVFYEPVQGGPCCVRDATHWMPIPKAPNA